MIMIKLSVLIRAILHWNARSLTANGQELQKIVEAFKETPDIICIQETWLKPCLDFSIPGYGYVNRGGCATFLELEIQYQRKGINTELECVITEVWTTGGNISVVNIYKQELIQALITLLF